MDELYRCVTRIRNFDVLARANGSKEKNLSLGPTDRAEYQHPAHRIKGFCPALIDDPGNYIPHFTEIHRLREETGATRITSRLVAKTELADPSHPLGLESLFFKQEAVIPLGGDWKGYSFVMLGQNEPERQIRQEVHSEIAGLARRAMTAGAEHVVKPVQELKDGYRLEALGDNISDQDAVGLAEIYREAFEYYLTDDYEQSMHNPAYIKKWAAQESVAPVIIRSPSGQIITVAAADFGMMNFQGKPFRYMELGDSATRKEATEHGFNRILKKQLILAGVAVGADLIYTEPRATFDRVNYTNALCGLTWNGILPQNSYIRSPYNTIHEGGKYQTMNVWSIVPDSPAWSYYDGVLMGK